MLPSTMAPPPIHSPAIQTHILFVVSLGSDFGSSLTAVNFAADREIIERNRNWKFWFSGLFFPGIVVVELILSSLFCNCRWVNWKSIFENCQHMLNSISGSLGSKAMVTLKLLTFAFFTRTKFCCLCFGVFDFASQICFASLIFCSNGSWFV